MPELPEVETVRRGLAPVLEGVSLEHVETRRADLRFPFPDKFVARLKGAAIETLDRRGKYLIGHLSTGESLIMHLGMSGRFDVVQNFDARKELPGTAKHDHVIFEVGKKSKAVRIVYNDVRRFGFMDLVSTAELEGCKHFKGMGPEPLGNGFSAQALGEALKKKSSPIKTALLDQRVVAGLGNIYVCEALFRAGISPRRQSKSVAGRRSERLYPIIVEVLRDAIAAGGSTLKDFAATDGELGYFQHRFDVYGREGEDCRNCGTEILRFVQGGRSTFYCSTCQR